MILFNLRSRELMNATVLNLKRKKKRERINRFIKIVNKFLDLYISIGTITRLIGIILIPIEKILSIVLLLKSSFNHIVLFIKKKKKWKEIRLLFLSIAAFTSTRTRKCKFFHRYICNAIYGGFSFSRIDRLIYACDCAVLILVI